MIKLIIADDHPLIIEGMRSALLKDEEIHFLGEVKNGLQLLEMMNNQEPDVVIMDINMPDMDGIEATQEVRKRFPDVKVIAFSQYDDKHFIKRMLKAGAKGYLLKSTPVKELIKAVKIVREGSVYLGKGLPDFYTTNKSDYNSSFDPVLTQRETEVLKLICMEKNTREIAYQLFISLHTVETHRANLLQKTGVRNIAGLVKWAMENGMAY
ncbi:MAG: response regulator transcription factor [Bacteroidales bacterium]|nr:response regulator transcription factor [Bacteroidales bacterium]